MGRELDEDATDVKALLLSDAELFMLTGYRRAAEQLAELRRQGFSRARRDRLGRVILERAHYQAVCAGLIASQRPKVRLLTKATVNGSSDSRPRSGKQRQ